MYEMVTGKVPFDADTPVSVALKHMQEEPEEPIELNPNLPSAVNKIIMKALKKDTTLRYQTASEMLTDLRRALKNPDGEFVDDREYDETAKTQKINTDLYGNIEENSRTKNKNGKKEGKFKKFIKEHKALSIVIGLILLFALSLGGTLAFLNLTNPPEVELPNLVGMSKEEAQKEAENLKLKFEIKEEEFNKEIPEGFIISQDPKYIEKYNVKEGSTITVVVSKGQEKTKVPNVKGKSQEEALQLLEEAKLKAEIIEETSKTVKEGYVISQETEPDEEAFAGDTVKIHISKGTGIKQVNVVSVIGQNEANAKTTLTGLGLKVNVAYEEDTSKADGIVLKQSLEGGKTVNEGTTITITVNKIAEMKEVSVSVNVKSLLGGNIYEESSNTTNSSGDKKVKKVNLKVVVGNDTIYSSKVSASETSIKATTKGKGTKEIKVYIDDVLKNQGQIKYGEMTAYTAE